MSVSHKLIEWKNFHWSTTLESLDPEDESLWRMTKRVTRLPTPSPLGTPGGTALSDSEKAEALADILETEFQAETDLSSSAVIEMINVVLRSYFLSPASLPQLSNPDDVHDVIRGLKISRAPGPNGIPNRVLKFLPQSAVYLLTQVFNSLLLTHDFPTMWKHARVMSILKPGKDPAPLSSYRPISLLDTIGKIFEKNLLARILTSLTGAVFLDVAKAFDTLWIDGLL
jgi:hypothetical protein